MYVEGHGAAECGLKGMRSGQCMWVNVFACGFQAKHTNASSKYIECTIVHILNLF